MILACAVRVLASLACLSLPKKGKKVSFPLHCFPFDSESPVHRLFWCNNSDNMCPQARERRVTTSHTQADCSERERESGKRARVLLTCG